MTPTVLNLLYLCKVEERETYSFERRQDTEGRAFLDGCVKFQLISVCFDASP